MKIHSLLLRVAGLLVSVAALLTGPLLRAITLTVTPLAVSNTYNGYITLQIGGVPSGAGVVVQKFLDANSNGVVDAGDILVQQGNPQDGKGSPVIGGATNFNVPGDNDGTANGSIMAKILFNNGDFIQKAIGQYLFVISSTNGAFTPVTNAFSVTNIPYTQKITGTVTNNTGAAVPNALVIMFPPPRSGGGDHGPGTPVGAGVANGSGVYAIPMPVGSYVPMAFRSNYVANYSTSPLVTLPSGQTLTTNLSLSNTTTSVSGSYVDVTNSGRVLAGVFAPLSSSGGLIAGGFTDSNGNFNVPVPPGQAWNVGDASGLIVHGYVGYENQTNVNSGTTGVTIGFARETALFYGTVLDNLGNPIPGIAIEASDQNNNIFQQDGWTDTNGNYVVAAVGGLGSNDPWQVNVDQNPTNYVFSQPAIQQNGGTNIAVSQAVQVNFTGVLATGAITGHVQYNGSPVVGVGVNAFAFTNGVTYQPDTAHTDSSGNYTLYVANAAWSISLNCNGGSDSIDNILNGNFGCPQSQNASIANNTGTANFTVQVCAGPQISTTSLPAGQVNSSYDYFLQGSTCTGTLNWTLIDPQDFPGSLSFGNNGEIFGLPDTAGAFVFSVQLDDGQGAMTNQQLSLTINPAIPQLQVSTVALQNGTNGVFYSQTLQATGGVGADSWALAPGSASLPANLSLGTNGLISGTPVVNVTNLQFIAQVTDANSDVATKTLSLIIVGSGNGLSLALVPQPGNTLLQFTFSGAGGVNYSLQTSPDLKTWTTVLSFTGAGSAETISAPTTGASKSTFYRIKIGP